MVRLRLIQDDCITAMNQLIEEDIKVDLILTDPPYGTVKGMELDGWDNQTTSWDSIIPTNEMFDCCEKLLRMNGVCILFSQEPYTSYLRQFKPTNLPFIYPLYWLKDHFANPLVSKKAPVSYVEDLSVYRKRYDSDNKHPLRNYSEELLNELGMTKKDIISIIGGKADHFFRYNSSQFALCTEETYNEMIEKLHIDKLDCFKSYSELMDINSKFNSKFNSKGNFKSNVLEYPKSYNHYHPTEKPVELLEDMIGTYTEQGDTVLDFTMGSGSTGVACKNLNRDFIGIEINKEYFDIANKRINEFQSKLVI